MWYDNITTIWRLVGIRESYIHLGNVLTNIKNIYFYIIWTFLPDVILNKIF